MEILTLRLRLCLAVVLFASLCSAQPPHEYEVKAAFLLNFTKFVEWPATALADQNAPLVICIVGDDPFGAALDQIVKGEEVNGRTLTVRRMRTVPRSHTCQVLFFAKSEKNLRKLLPEVGPGVLTVGEADDFLKSGGMIAFVIENRRVRFDIKQSSAADAGLVVSSKLLNVARSVSK